MTKCALITHSDAKRTIAAALAAAKARNRWSNADAGDAMGCGEGTVRNRLSEDVPMHHQMTVFELLRMTQADGTAVANAVFALTGHQLVPDGAEGAVEALQVAAGAARCAAELIAAAPDGIDPGEARRLLPMLEAHDREVSAMLVECRRVLSEARR